MTIYTKPGKFDNVRYMPASAYIGAADRLYLEYPLRNVLEAKGGGKLYGNFPRPDVVKERLLPCVAILDRLSVHFGLNPSVPVFFSWAAELAQTAPDLYPRLEPLFSEYTGQRPPLDLRGWTPSGEPGRPRIALSEYDADAGRWVLRAAEALLQTACHEFAHRLQLEARTRPIVEAEGWAWDRADGDCSSAAVEFAESVARRSSATCVMLNDSSGRGYRDLSRRCRVKAGLPAEPSFAELGLAAR